MKYELPIYGANDEVINRHATNICPFEVYIRAAELREGLANMKAAEQLKAVGELLKSMFPELTDKELARADAGDVFNTFMQIVNGGQKIKVGNGKNA